MGLSETLLTRYYGAPGEVDRVTVLTPWGIKVQFHRKVAGLFRAACYEADEMSEWKPLRIDGYVNRLIRGSTGTPSKHARALAADFFATPPGVVPPGGVWTPDNGLPHDFALCFTRRGFTWGANWQRKDVPHIEWNQAPPASLGPVPEPAHLPTETDMTGEEHQLLVDLHAWMSQEGKPMALRVAALQQELDALKAKIGAGPGAGAVADELARRLAG